VELRDQVLVTEKMLPGGRGTADMVRQAHRAGVIVWTPMRSDIAS